MTHTILTREITTTHHTDVRSVIYKTVKPLQK